MNLRKIKEICNTYNTIHVLLRYSMELCSTGYVGDFYIIRFMCII